MGKFKKEHGYSRLGGLLHGAVKLVTKGAISLNPKVEAVQQGAAMGLTPQQALQAAGLTAIKDVGNALGAGVQAAQQVLQNTATGGAFAGAFPNALQQGGVMNWIKANVATALLIVVAIGFIVKKFFSKKRKY